MKRRIWILAAALIGLSLFQAPPANAAQRVIVRTTSLTLLQQACVLDLCQVKATLDGTIGQLFLVTAPDWVGLQPLMSALALVPGVQNVEPDLLNHVTGSGDNNLMAPGLWQQSPVSYFNSTVWYGYAQQPAVGIIRLGDARDQFRVTGHAIVADIDTGVDFSHPALSGVLLQGYDFTRNRPGGNELADISQPVTTGCSQCQPAYVNQSTAAVLDQSTAAVLDSPQYAAFGHGTMVAGVIHLVAPTTKLMPLKAFRSDGTGYTSDILRAIYYAIQNGAQVVNMSFDMQTYSNEMARAINNANRSGLICVASAGNEDSDALVYPAGLGNVMGTASTTNSDTRSSFSNYGKQLVWVAAPGEQIISTYPYGTYASSSGTSFSAPMVAGTAALILDMNPKATPQDAAAAVAHAKLLTADLNNGRLDVFRGLAYVQAVLSSSLSN